MGDGFHVETPSEDDFAGMLASIEGRIERTTIAHALGVKEYELDLIAIGHAPKAGAGERLRMLYELAQRTEGDLRNPGTLLEAAGLALPDGGLMVPISLMPRLKTFFIAFLLIDAIVFGVFFLVFVLRS